MAADKCYCMPLRWQAFEHAADDTTGSKVTLARSWRRAPASRSQMTEHGGDMANIESGSVEVMDDMTAACPVAHLPGFSP
ncbi:hypothetical protein LTR95_008846, partial [Oleoguttula sp. CCFEE 5521]